MVPPVSRSVEEWIGKNDDAKIPKRVKLRLFLIANGICNKCSVRIIPGAEWDIDHIIPLILGGEHRESNFQVLCKFCHKEKTKNDVAEKTKSYKKKLKHYGLKESRTPMPFGRKSKWRKKINGQIVPR